MMSHLDDSVGRILAKLDELKLSENTVVIFTSDNGGYSNETSNRPLEGGKGNLYEGGIRVPLLVRWPEKIEAGSTCNESVISTDYFPTFLDIANLPAMPSAHLDGVSLVPLWNEKSLTPRKLYWHFPHRHTPESAIIDGDWKLIRKIEAETIELFNLGEDPYEKKGLAEAFPERAEQMEKQLESHLQESGAQRMRPNPNWNPEEPKGRQKNFGVYYPESGRAMRLPPNNAPYPQWFSE